MHIWKIIRQRPDRTPVPVDLALEALRPSSPKALLLRLHNAGHLLEELEPDAIMKAAKDYFAAIGEATNQFDKRLAPVETMTPYLSDPSTWARLHILREELLALRAALRLESLRAARRARLAKESPASAPPAATPPPAANHQSDQQTALHRGEKVYRRQKEITEAFNKHSGKKAIGWPAIRLKREQGLNIVYEPHGLKEVPTLDHYDLLDFFDLLPR